MFAGRHAAVEEESIFVAILVVVVFTSGALGPVLIFWLERCRRGIGNFTGERVASSRTRIRAALVELARTMT